MTFYIIDAAYAEKGKVLLRFMDEQGRLINWVDKTGHVPYLLSSEPSTDKVIKSTEVVEKFDGVHQELRKFYKLNVSSPTDVYDKKKGTGLRNRITPNWESDIRYYDCFMYDRNLTYLMPCTAKGDQVSLQDADKLSRTLDRKAFAEQWKLFVSTTIPNIPFAAIDFEMLVSAGSIRPDVEKADQAIIAFSLVSNTEKKILLLSEFHDERILLEKIWKTIEPYTIIITFFGDEFDLPYYAKRCQNLGLPFGKEIYVERGKGYQIKQSHIRNKVHLDMFKFFNNSSIRQYAYKDMYGVFPGLPELAKVFLNDEKAGDRRLIAEMSPEELSKYCLHDSEMTYDLAKRAWPLMCLLSRICRMPLREVCRQKIGSFVRSMLYAEMRKLGYLIPSKEDMQFKNSQYADFKGDSIEGAYIFPPVEGFHEKVFQLDVSSLYPSMIDIHNIGFESVECGHDECKSNVVPYHGFHICTKQPALLSIIVGTLKDMRLDVKKQLSDKKRELQVID
jgi:DNA polymerase I